MKLVSYFSEIRLNYCELTKIKAFSGIKKRFRKKKKINTQSAMWQPLGAPRVMLMSARGPPNADVIMAFDDVSVDLVNIDQVNGQLGPRSGGATCQRR